MRPGTLLVDAQTLQVPGTTLRGIGRYAAQLSRALLARDDAAASVLLNPTLPMPSDLDAEVAASRQLGWATASTIRAGVADGPRAYLLLSPFDDVPGGAFLLPQLAEGDLPLVTLLYDLIPLLAAHEHYPSWRYRWYRARLELVRTADLVLTLSAPNRAAELLAIDPARVRAIGAAPSTFFRPPLSPAEPRDALTVVFPELERSFVMVVSTPERHKNLDGLLRAWGRVSAPERAAHQLVVVGRFDPAARRRWRRLCRDEGLGDDAVLFVGRVGDAVLRSLYQAARLCVVPSFLEGFGLPAAEAMACGCPVVVSFVESLRELVGFDLATFDPSDPEDMATCIERVLTDEALRTQLGEHCLGRARALSWEAVADRVVTAVDDLLEVTSPMPTPRPRVAFVGAFAPLRTVAAEANVDGVEVLRHDLDLDVDVFAVEGSDRSDEGGERRLPFAALGRLRSLRSYDVVVYSVSDDWLHLDVVELATRHPGVVWLHDDSLVSRWLAELTPSRRDSPSSSTVVEGLRRRYGLERFDPGELLSTVRGAAGELSAELVASSRAAVGDPAALADAVADLTGQRRGAARVRARPVRTATRQQTTRSLGYSRVCRLEDFDHPDVQHLVRDVYRNLTALHGADFPAGFEERKQWEIAMSARAFRDHGVLHEGSEVLGVGAGQEATSFWLTNHVRRVFATDLYITPGMWGADAPLGMLLDPEAAAPGRWNRRRLVVQHMDALDLKYADDSFDGVYSASSIEHFGGRKEVARAAAEMCRVLKPGGILALSTEYRIAGPPPGIANALLFDSDALHETIIGDLDWDLVDPLDVAVTPATLATETLLADGVADRALGGTFRRYPHVVLREGDRVWTSVHLTLRKR